MRQLELRLVQEAGEGGAEARQGGLVLGIDDAHLLDDLSASLVQRLVASGSARVILTVRTGEREPEGIVGLWKEVLVENLELMPLSERQAEELLCEALGGVVDGGTLRRLWEVTRGNPLYLRQLVVDGLERGLLDGGEGVWRWRGPLVPGRGLVEIIESRLGELSESDRRLLELVAVGEPLEVGLLERVSMTGGLEGLERRGLLEVGVERRRVAVRLAHPLYGEVLRARAPVLGTRGACAVLADALERVGVRRRGDLLRAAVWRLDGGLRGEPEQLIAAAEPALAVLDAALAERLARAALEVGGGDRARRMLASALAGRGAFAEAEALFASVESGVKSDAERSEVALARASNLFFGLGRAEEAEAVALRGEALIEDQVLRDQLAAWRAYMGVYRGRPRDVLSAASSILDRKGVEEAVGVQAAFAAITALAVMGRCDTALALAADWDHVAVGPASDQAGSLTSHATIRALPLWLGGYLDQAQALAEEHYSLALEQRGPEGRAIWTMILGAVWLSRGAVRTTLRWLRESVVLWRDFDPIGHLPWCLSFLAQAAALAGDAEGATAAVLEAEAARRPGIRTWEVGLALARAWAEAASGDRVAAREWARRAADQAEQAGQLASAVWALTDLARFGEPAIAAARLQALMGVMEGPLAPVCAAYATAAARNDGVGLDQAAAGFDAVGARLLAAEASAAAANAHRDAGQATSARASQQRATVWLEQCEGARPPTLGAIVNAAELTERETQIALLAASGLANDAIAAQLVLSVRTVENHLQHAYNKLEICSRSNLAAALGALDSRSPTMD